MYFLATETVPENDKVQTKSWSLIWTLSPEEYAHAIAKKRILSKRGQDANGVGVEEWDPDQQQYPMSGMFAIALNSNAQPRS